MPLLYYSAMPLQRRVSSLPNSWFRKMNVSQRSLSQVSSRKSRSHPDPRQPLFTIGDVAKEFGVSLRTLRFYEDRGLLAPYRDGTARYYTEQDKSRLTLILKGKHLGFTLGEIRDLLTDQKGNRSDKEALDLDPEQIAAQIGHLERQRSEIDEAIAELRAAHQRLRRPA